MLTFDGAKLSFFFDILHFLKIISLFGLSRLHCRSACLQRGGGLAQWRGTLSVMRGTNVQVRTKRSAELYSKRNGLRISQSEI